MTPPASTSSITTSAPERSAGPRPIHFAILALAAIALTLLAIAPAALARTTRPYQSSFGAFPGHWPSVLTVDQATGDVYAVSDNNAQNKVWRFTADGASHDFTAGPDAGTNTLLTGFVGSPIRGIAVDNSGDPFNGDLYVVDSQNTTVKVFASSGAPLGNLVGTGTGDSGGHFSNNICGVAVDDSNGAVYVSETQNIGYGGHIWRYMPSSPSGAVDDSDYTLTAIKSNESPCDLAAASGSLYARDHSGASTPSLDRYSASSFTADFSALPKPTTIDTGTQKTGVAGVAVDPKTGEVYANEGDRIAVFDPAGTLLYDFGAAAYFGSGFDNSSKGIAVASAASGPATTAYAADPRAEGGEIDVFGPVEKVPTFTHPDLAAFGPDGTTASSFVGHNFGPSPLGPDQLAFDQAARRLYAVEPHAPGIYGFDASAPPAYPPLAAFAPLATAASDVGSGLAVDNTALGSAGNLYLASGATELLYGWTSAGSPLGGAFPVDPATTPGPPSGSPTSLCGSAVDSAGNLFLANSATKRILKYSSAGASLPGAIDTSAQGTPCRLAFDSSDNLYVGIGSAETGNGVWKYTAASGYSSATRVAQGTPQALAIDPSTDRLYVSTYPGRIDEYDSAGNLLDEFASSTASLGLSPFSGLAVDATNHDLYASDGEKGKIRVFGPGILLPELTARPASAITNTTATLAGTVITQGLVLSDCHFEYVTEAAFNLSGFSDLSSGGSATCAPAAASIPLDLEEHPLSAAATGLTENTAYRYRLSATNANGTTLSADDGFTATGPPLVETTGSPLRTATTARLEGRVDPSRAAATYHFEYGDQGPCDANPCEATEAHAAGSGKEIELVSQQLENLQPGTTYHYRLIADNANPSGPATGQDMTVTTRASDAPLSHGHFPGPPGSDRAWEQVSLPDTGGNPVDYAFAVSDNGNRAFYKVSGGTPLSVSGSLLTPLYAERTETAPHQGGWHSENIYPPRDQLVGTAWIEPAGRSDLSEQVVENLDTTSTNPPVLWRLRPGQPAEPVLKPPLGAFDALLVSNDGSRILALLRGSFDPAHPAPNSAFNLYDITSATPRLVGLLPDGSVPVCGAQISNEEGGAVPRASRWISPDGSLAFFESSCTGLYVRNLLTEQTKLIAAAPASFLKSTPAAAFFTTTQSLDPADTGGSDVYRYDLGDESLKCVTCVVAGLNANVNSNEVAIAADGSRLYFASSTALLPGAATPGIYRIDVASGALAYVAPGAGLGENPTQGEAITPDGSAIVFASANPGLNALGGQQNGGTLQYYRYDDRDRSLTCLSCPPDGSAPPASVSTTFFPPGVPVVAGANKTVLSADGETFAFATATPLVGTDQNTAGAGQNPVAGTDIYEWRDGRLLLITDGLTNWPVNSEPSITAVTPSGQDVFFVEAAQLTPDALDGYKRLYDARIGGGFEFPVPPKPCPLEVCQGTPKGAPVEQAPGTGSFAGPGNAHQHAHHKKKRHHRKHRANHKRRAAR